MYYPILIKSIDFPIFKAISEASETLNVHSYVIGGYVRDHMIGRKSKDVDIVTDGNGIELANLVAQKLKIKKVNIFKTFGTAMFMWDDWQIEFVGARKESYTSHSRNPIVSVGTIEEDQDRRDFTINAMAISLQKADYGFLIDPFNGSADLEKGIIRTPLDPDITFSDDPLRMMRAVRFSTQLGFEILPETLDSIKKNAHRIEIVTMERIIEELNKIVMSNIPSKGFYLLDATGLLGLIFPTFVKLKGAEFVEGKGHKDNFRHTLEVLDRIAPNTHNLWLRWSALLHDIGKPSTKRFDQQLGWTFHGHEFRGMKMVPAIFNQLRLPMNEKM